jgi:hypothetical protein
VLDFYSFYEDTGLYHALFQAWQHAHARAALTAFYPTERTKLSKLNKLAVQTLYNHLEAALLAAGRDEEEEAALAAEAAAAVQAGAGMDPTTPAKPRRMGEEEQKADDGGGGNINDVSEAARARAMQAKLRAKRRRAADNDYYDIRLRTRLVEEMTLAAAAHRAFKSLAFESSVLLPFLLSQLRSLGRLRQYMLPADPAAVWALVSSREDLLIEDEVDQVRYVIALWNLLARLLAGSEPIAARTKLLAWDSTSREPELKQTMDDLFLLGGIPLPPERGVHAQQQQQLSRAGTSASAAAASAPLSPLSPLSPGGTTSVGSSFLTPSAFLDALDAHVAALQARGDRARLVDEEDRQFSAAFLYNRRAQRKWKEGVLAAHAEQLKQEAASASTAATRQRLAALQGGAGNISGGPAGLHVRDVARIVATHKAEQAALLARRGPSAAAGRSRRNLAAAKDEAIFASAPRSADEVGHEAVALSNNAAEKVGLEALQQLVPELEVAFMDLLFHFVQLLEHVLEARVPFLTVNLDHLLRHLLLEEQPGRDFASLQVPVLARGLVHLCQKERRPPLSYYCFVYASVLSKLMLRSAELQALLEEQHFLSLLAGPTRAAQQQHQLVLLPDIKAATLAPNARGLHFYQRTKPLLQHMLDLMVNK